jgi:uncharacterized protein (DUF2235 family)
MSSGLSFFVGVFSAVIVLAMIVAVIVVGRRRQERRFSQAMLIAQAWAEDEDEESPQSERDLFSMTSALSYGLLLRQAILERCEVIEDDDERLGFVDDLVEIAEAYGNGLVKRSKSSRY